MDRSGQTAVRHEGLHETAVHDRGEQTPLLPVSKSEGQNQKATSRASYYGLLAGFVAMVCVGGSVISVLSLADDSGKSNRRASGFQSGAVATDAEVCSKLGSGVLEAGGSAVDAAIASVLCIGAVNSHSSGLGGGGFMLVRNDTAVETIDFRETAPAAASERMFTGFSDCNVSGGQGDTSRCPSRLGGLAVGVPGELRGLEEAHRRHGRLPWREVLAPVISLCRNGFLVTGANAAAIRESQVFIEQDPLLNSTFMNNGKPYVEGEVIRRPLLAKTLERVAEEGAEVLYTGEIAERIVESVKNNTFRTGNLTLDDMSAYAPAIRTAVAIDFRGRTVYSAPPPASGAVLALILNIVDGFSGMNCTHGRSIIEDHRIIESFKFGYGARSWISDPCCDAGSGCQNATHCALTKNITEEMVDRLFAEKSRDKIFDNRTNHTAAYYGGDFDVQDTPGTTHISIVAPDGSAVSVTSTINTHFGAKIMTSDGIILNNQMDDFSSPGFSNAYGFEPSPVNFIRPHKRPLSSSAPTIVVSDRGEVDFVAGASGGSKITTAVAQVLLNVLAFCDDVRTAVDRPRIHHQLLPMRISGEQSYPVDRKDKLLEIGHYWNNTKSNGVVQAIARGTVGPADANPELLYAASDGTRKPGAVAWGY